MSLVAPSFAQYNYDQALSLDGTWKFKTDPYGKGESLTWFAEGHNDQGWDSLQVPGNWDLLNEYSHYAGKAWYRREVFVSPLWKDKLVRLLFEAVSFNSKVWLNGRLLGSNDNGYLPFEFDVTSMLRYGGKNVITVMCDNTHRIGALWNWGGIRRPVQLVAGEKWYVSSQFISPSVDLAKHTAEIAIRVTCRNAGIGSQNVRGRVVLYNKDNYKKTLPFSIVVEGGAQADVIVTTAMNSKEVHLWNCDDPFLYYSEVYLENGEKQELQVSDRFGLRKIELDNTNFLFKLNGEVMRSMGFNLVPDDRTTGSVLPLWRVKQDVDLLKSLGANMARLTHLPLHREMLDYLDEKGILVFSEVPLWGLSQLTDKTNPVPRAWLERLVRDNYNHPCIIGWSVGNEIGDSPGVMEYVEDAIRRIRKLDSTRLGVMVSHTATNTTDPLQYADMGLVNKYGKNIGALAETMHRLHPEKILFYSEFGYGQLGENLDSDVDAHGMMDSIRFKPWLIGGALWTFNDYRSSYAGNKEYSENRAWGIVDVFRQKKKAWYSFRKEYAPVTALKVQADQSVKNKMLVSIVPRQVLDLPAYVLNDYRLVWQGFDDHGELKDGGFIRLPVIRPGDQEISSSMLWKDMSALSSLKIELLSPGNYSVYDTLICLNKPMAPVVTSYRGVRTQMNDVPANSGSIRVTFNKAHPGAAYKVKYGINELSQESALTLNNYVDIPNLPFGQLYHVAVVGVNACGESDVYVIKQIKVDTGYAPPIIYYAEPADRGFYVGYATEKDDYMFSIQYTLIQGDYSNAATIQATTKGVMFVPGLLNGKQYYFRMSRIKDNNFITPWSEEHVIVPDGGQAPSPPSLLGVLRDGSEAIVVFEPVKKAIAYSIEYREKGSPVWQTICVNASAIRQFTISGLKAKRLYEFRMYCENSYSKSTLSAGVTK